MKERTMKLLRNIVMLAVCAAPVLLPESALASGCYICGGGSTEACKNYCRYSGEDTFAARKDCEKRGCKVSGTASCPTAVNYKVCLAPVPEKSDFTVAATTAILWCSADQPS
jgi:hypothetical protein